MKMTHGGVWKALAVGAAGTAVLALGPQLAVAQTAPAPTSGVLSQGCAVHWEAAAALNTGLPDYSLAAFTVNVSPSRGEPGIMEVQHFFTGGPIPVSDGRTLMFWRVPLGTDHAIQNATVTVSLPTNIVGSPVFTFVSDANLQTFFGGPPGRFPWSTSYTWSPIPTANAVDNGDGSWTIALGDMPAGAAHGFSLQALLPTGTRTDVDYLANVKLTGTYGYGSPATCQPAPVPANQPWALFGVAALAGLAGMARLRRKR